MSLEAPKMVGAGQEYTATLKVEVPPTNIVVASINQEKIINPANNSLILKLEKYSPNLSKSR